LRGRTPGTESDEARMSSPSAPPPAAGAGQRQSPRYACEITTEYAILEEPDTLPRPARLLNISRSGMAVVVEELLLPQMTLAVELHRPGGLFSCLLAGEIVHALPHRDGWMLGCRFHRPLTPDELANLL